MNPFQRLVVRVCNINLNDAAVRFNVEQALREQRRQGKEEGLAQGRKEKPDCLTCPLWRAEQIRLTGNSEMFAEPNTNGDIAVQQKDIMPPWFKKRNPDKVITQVLVDHGRMPREMQRLIYGTDNEREKKIS